MSVLAIIELRARPGAADQLRALINRAQIRRAEGNETVDLAVSQNDPNVVLLVERWASGEAFEAYRTADDNAVLRELIEAETVRVCDLVPRPARVGAGSRMEALEDLEEWAKRWLGLRAEIRALNDAGLSNEHLGPVIRLHNEELDSIMQALEDAQD